MTHNLAYVVGLDLSLTRVAVAVITGRVDGSTVANAATFTSRAPREERIADLVAVADHAVCAAALAVLGSCGSGWAGELLLVVRSVLAARGVPVATGSEGMTDAARLWPVVKPSNTAEVTALSLAHLGAVRLGWDLRTLPRHRAAVEGITWPQALAVAG